MHAAAGNAFQRVRIQVRARETAAHIQAAAGAIQAAQPMAIVALISDNTAGEKLCLKISQGCKFFECFTALFFDSSTLS